MIFKTRVILQPRPQCIWLNKFWWVQNVILLNKPRCMQYKVLLDLYYFFSLQPGNTEYFADIGITNQVWNEEEHLWSVYILGK